MSISAYQLSYSYNNSAPLSFPDFKLSADEHLAILGPSGCGKTTFLHLLCGLLHPKTGTVQINKTNISLLKPSKSDAFRGRHIGLIFQKHYFLKALSIAENLKLSSALAKQKVTVNTIRDTLNQLGLKGFENKKPGELSVGEQQRVSIARVLLQKPAVILADEPTSALDAKNATHVIELLKTTASKTAASLIVVTHDERVKNSFTNQLHLG